MAHRGKVRGWTAMDVGAASSNGGGRHYSEGSTDGDLEDGGGDASDMSEAQPLRSDHNNGVSNGGGGGGGGGGHDGPPVQIVPAIKFKHPPSRFEMDEETQNWRRTESSSSPSPTPSSPSSQFKKKLVFTVPGIMRPKQPRENKLRAFVVFMFFVLVLMISLTYVYHQQHLLKIMQIAVGERIRFGENNRVLQLSNPAKQCVLVGHLGKSLATDELPRNCHVRVESGGNTNETACLEWNHLATMRVNRFLVSESTKCYQVRWKAQQEGLSLQDCFSLSDAHWYGIGELKSQLWPLDFVRANDTEFVTGNVSIDTFGQILEGYWVSSKGVAIMADVTSPLRVSIDKDVGELCLRSRSTETTPLATLQYTLCTAWDMHEVHRQIAGLIRPKPSVPPDWEVAVEAVVWSTHQRYGDHVNESVLFNFTEEVMLVDPSTQRTLLLDSSWQDVEGDFNFHSTRFPKPRDVMSAVNNRGFRIILKVHPYVSTASASYYKYLDESYWVRDISGRVPTLVRWSDLPSAVMVDFTNEAAAEWFRSTLLKMKDDYHVHSFQFHGGQATSLPIHATYFRPLLSRNTYANLYKRAVTASSQLAFSVGTAAQSQPLPSFVECSSRKPTWGLPNGLRSLIPTVLSAGLVGYPFVLTGPVGGESSNGNRPDRELFVRWLQVAAFFPVLQMSILPSDYDKDVASIAHNLLKLRRTVVLPQLKAAIEESVEFGIPIIRPLWWIAPNDTDAQDNDTEFLVGNDLLVAPILEPHADQRDIYLPPGLWTDRENNLHKGGKWIYDHRSALAKVAYFVRVQSNHNYA